MKLKEGNTLMKKTAIIIGILVGIVGIGCVAMHRHKKSDNDYNHNYQYSQGSYDKNSYHKKTYKEKSYSNNFTEVNSVPFNKGYNNDYDKSAVEKATREHSEVTLNKEFQVKGISVVKNGTLCEYTGPVDGDTIKVKINNKGKVRVIRFGDCDTAEDVSPRIHVIEPYSVQGADYVKSKLKVGEDIEVVFNKDKGKYEKDVGTIYYKSNGLWYNLNEEEVANGLARIAYLNKNNTTINVEEYYKAEDSAKEQKLNIWSIPGYVTKYGYNLAIFK